jgi:hypothetical protein
MSHESKPKIENLPEPEQELTAQEAEEAQGGIINSLEFTRSSSGDLTSSRAASAEIDRWVRF